MAAAVLSLDPAAFRALFPAFSANPPYTDELLQMYWDNATCFVSARNCGWLRGRCRQNAIYLMMAHLLQLGTVVIPAGQTPGYVQSATIDKITVTRTPPPVPNQWQWWLGTTPYGQQLLALLQAKGAGGLFIGGAPETSAFRKVYGWF